MSKSLQEIIQDLRQLLSTDSTDEDVAKVQSIENDLTEYSKSEEELVNKYGDLKSKYIDLVKNTPVYESSKIERKKDPRSLNEIIQDILKKKKEDK